MFQSLWNVAAAFCVHEEQTLVQQSYHFGHHQNTLCISHDRPHKHDTQSDHKDIKNNNLKLDEDHQDHLPSMTHLIVQNEKISVLIPVFETHVIPEFHWKNSYQAPDLFQQSPPPEFSPLMVG